MLNSFKDYIYRIFAIEILRVEQGSYDKGGFSGADPGCTFTNQLLQFQR